MKGEEGAATKNALSRNTGLREGGGGGLHSLATVTFEDQRRQMQSQTVESVGAAKTQRPRKGKFMEASLVLKELLDENERSRVHLQSLKKLSVKMNS